MSSVRIKVCGLIDPDDGMLAADAGVDLVGLNFVPSSKRCVDLRTAEAICLRLEDTPVERVAVFQDQSWEDIERVLRRVEFERVQLHGSETEEEVELIELPVIKALAGADLEAALGYPGSMLLLDHPSEGGGRGQAWDWSEASTLIEAGLDIIIAGGLDPTNVAQAIEAVGDISPWGVDVATGVEGEELRKDAARLAAFVEAVRGAGDEG